MILISASATARADYVEATLDPAPLVNTFQYTLNGTNGSAYALALHWTRTGGNSGLPLHFTTFCTELLQHVGFNGNYKYFIVGVKDVPFGGPGDPGPGPGMGNAKADLIRELWGTYRNQVHTADDEAAFQIAIWEIVNDADLNLGGSGTFHSNYSGAAPAFVDLAQTWLSSLGKNLPGHTLANDLVGLSSGSAQDQLTTVPAPPALALFSLGGLGFLTTMWRRRR
ncbi:MAG: PEP-CTERM sorting domain-containing protein [Gemmataceae bacterium]|nr:PEP-CTERM sorting domain-containing protein [Gemmataceae bacterium]